MLFLTLVWCPTLNVAQASGSSSQANPTVALISVQTGRVERDEAGHVKGTCIGIGAQVTPAHQPYIRRARRAHQSPATVGVVGEGPRAAVDRIAAQHLYKRRADGAIGEITDRVGD